jgi:hypothetical protein
MSLKTVIAVAISAVTILLGGCSTNTPIRSTSKILYQDEAKVITTINKDFSSTVINANTGKRIPPCRTDLPKDVPLSKLRKAIVECLPKDHPQEIGRTLTQGEFIMFEGSYCIANVIASHLYVYCQPPYDLGFPEPE